MSIVEPGSVAANVAAVRRRIAVAGGDRRVTLVAVTKTFPADALLAAVAAGCDAIGENYAQELIAKLDALGGAPGIPVHFIGNVQRNKVRSLAGRVDVWETLDRHALATEIARRAPGARVLVQVNVSGEPSKAGCDPADAEALVRAAIAAGLDVTGLMTVGLLGDPGDARPGFRLLRRIADDLGLADCSMGMSGDLEIAVEEGATIVRVGSALFGSRVRAPRSGLR
jgi:PLP dependent protein